MATNTVIYDLPATVFHITHLPNNVRLSRWLDRLLLLRACRSVSSYVSRWAFGCKLIASDGTFTYIKEGEKQHVVFNGRNAQFCALYEDHYHYGYEYETAVLLMRLAKGAGVFYDVGANWGYFSLLLSAVSEFTGSIYSFEPHPTTYQDLQRTIDQAGVRKRVTALNYGLGRVEGSLRIHQKDVYWTGAVQLRGDGKGQTVPVHTLDTITLPPAAIIKIDAEGMEADILTGGENTLRQHRPFIIFENYLDFDRPDKTWSPLILLQNLGYHLYNPTLGFRYLGRIVPVSYGDPVATLLEKDPHPLTCLVEVTPSNRFTMKTQINVFACHESRRGELAPADFVELSGF